MKQAQKNAAAMRRAKEKRIRDIDAILSAEKSVNELSPVLEKYNTIHFKGARDRFYQEHKDEIDRVKKAQWLLKKLGTELPLDRKALRKESRWLRGEVETLIPQMKQLDNELDRMMKIRSHIRKVLPEALSFLNEDGLKSYKDISEEVQNQKELRKLLDASVEGVSRYEKHLENSERNIAPQGHQENAEQENQERQKNWQKGNR